MKKLIAFILSLLMLLSLVPAFAEEAALTSDIIVLYTSDVHCGIDQNFGYAGLAAIRDALKAAGNHVFLADNGDAIQGEPVGTMTTGEAITDLMNAVGYDVAIPGNHEFDYGMDRFLELAEKANFPYISCNFNKEGKTLFDPYVIFEAEGVKLAFVGVTTPKTLTSSTPAYFMDENDNFIYGFMQDTTGEGVYNAVQSAVDAARAEGADYVILMGHMGNEASCKPWTYAEVIANTTGIDAMIDGHSHDTDQVKMINKDGQEVLRGGCGTKLAGVGYLKISVKGELSTGLYTWSNSVSADTLFGLNNEISAAVSAATATLNEKLSTVVAHTAFDLTIVDPNVVNAEGQNVRIVRSAETNLGDLCADAYLDQSGADVAIVNGGGVRTNIKAGDITLNNILKVHPFGNVMCVIEVTGQQLLDALEWGCHAMPSENGGFLQVAGMTFEVDPTIESPCMQDENTLFCGMNGGEYRVRNVIVRGEPLDVAKTYTLATHNYYAKNMGDGYTMFNGCTLLQDEVKIDNQVLIDYITGTLGGAIPETYADPYGQGRITCVNQ